MEDQPRLAKIVIEQEYSDDDHVSTECPWAEELGANRYRIKNFPFFAYGISFMDIVEACPKYENDDRPYFRRVVEKSGHRTLRVIFDEPLDESERSQQLLTHLNEMGCGSEGFDGKKFFVINVQPHCDFEGVCEFLTRENIEWEHADPTYEQIYGSET